VFANFVWALKRTSSTREKYSFCDKMHRNYSVTQPGLLQSTWLDLFMARIL